MLYYMVDASCGKVTSGSNWNLSVSATPIDLLEPSCYKSLLGAVELHILSKSKFI